MKRIILIFSFAVFSLYSCTQSHTPTSHVNTVSSEQIDSILNDARIKNNQPTITDFKSESEKNIFELGGERAVYPLIRSLRKTPLSQSESISLYNVDKPNIEKLFRDGKIISVQPYHINYGILHSDGTEEARIIIFNVSLSLPIQELFVTVNESRDKYLEVPHIKL